MEALDNAWYGSWRLLTNLTKTFQACHLFTFNVAAIFLGVIPTYGVLPYAMIIMFLLREREINPREKFQDSAGIWTQYLLNTSQMLLPLSHLDSR